VKGGIGNMSAQLVREFNADLGELSLLTSGKHWKRFNANKIEKIQRTTGSKKVLFFSKPVETIEIHIQGEDTPYIIQKGSIKDDFQWIVDVLKRFAEKNKVPFSG
jgi:hypothetical protein